ncbi:hypothetical protein F7R91_14485 [Streptomyces luteolifulvus]|uniref:Uncharacterized protein n=1 Tax=Streptomyces luteolifulvus TaxID=2615112 RepID=A0A6H9UZF7_9ACTN|nr:hypothetical protein [Streptomyces luteolifulvus]KAB1146784.1 hypothetical protein F7R91_14485 [Streptomyces luteolifulvus]
MTDQPAPLTAQQLADIDARAAARRAALSGWINCYSPLDEQEALEDAEAVLEEDMPALLAEVRRLHDETAPLTDSERTMLRYALDLAQEQIWSEGGFTDDDQAAVDSLRARVDGQTPPAAASSGVVGGRQAPAQPPGAPEPPHTPAGPSQGRTGAAADAGGRTG